MDQITATNKQGTPCESLKRCFTVKKFAVKNREQGTWPDSESAIWALRAESPHNGFGEAFITVGRRVLIDEHKFWEAIARLQEVEKCLREDDWWARQFVEGVKEIAKLYDLFETTRELAPFDGAKQLCEDLNNEYGISLDLLEFVKLGRSFWERSISQIIRNTFMDNHFTRHPL